MKRTLIIKTLVCVLFATLISCGKKGTNKMVLNTKEGVSEIKKIIEDNFELEKEIYTLSFSNKSRDLNEVEQISIQFIKDGKISLWFYTTLMDKLFKPEPTKNSSTRKMLKLKSFKVEDILLYFNKAIVLVEKETKEFENYRLEGFDMSVDEKSGKIIHSFSLLADKTTKSTSFYGKRIGNSNVFKFSFRTDKEGEKINKLKQI